MFKAKDEILPIGSVVKLYNYETPIMVISKCSEFEEEDGKKAIKDYIGCIYPIGLINSNIRSFNTEEIQVILHIGYRDEKNDRYDNDIMDVFKSNLEKKIIKWQ